jgi:hypothetical protein
MSNKKEKKILLVDVDSVYPNIALMKISSFYKSKGYVVELKKLNYSFFNQKPKQKERTTINAKGYEKVFISILFTSNRYKVFVLNCWEIEYGGTGYSIEKKLPEEIEKCQEDYSIYNEKRTSYGFITRGCIRNCAFCFVPRKEGMIHKYRNISEIFRPDLGHERARFYDNNILAFEGWKEILQELIDKKLPCAFSQGLDLRLLTEENAGMIKQLKYISEIYFAFDDVRLMPLFEEKIKIIEKYFKPWQCRFYLYVHPSMDWEQDIMKRINFLREHKCLIYVMRDIACLESEQKERFSTLASWGYKVPIYCSCTFENYCIGIRPRRCKIRPAQT